MSRTTIWSPNYAPELTGIPPLITDAAEWLSAAGHAVHVVTAFPNYPSRRIDPAYRSVLWRTEQRNGVRVDRSWLRVRPGESFVDKAFYELSFSTVSFPFAARAALSSDVLLCVVPTLLAAVYSRMLGLLRPRLRTVLWVQDLVLEGALALRLGRVATEVLRAAGAAERFAARGADAVVVCSPGFRDYLVDRGVDNRRVRVIYNWADTDWIVPGHTRQPNESISFLYAGNVGYSQGLDVLVRAAPAVGASCTVRIVGDGNDAARIRDLAASEARVEVALPVERDQYPALLASADCHVVIQRRVSAGANLPSKIATALASGRPIIASLELGSPAAELLRESGAAVLVEPEDPAALAAAMTELARDPARRAELGARARAFAERMLSKESALHALEEVLAG